MGDSQSKACALSAPVQLPCDNTHSPHTHNLADILAVKPYMVYFRICTMNIVWYLLTAGGKIEATRRKLITLACLLAAAPSDSSVSVYTKDSRFEEKNKKTRDWE
jgi:hypothetical protein